MCAMITSNCILLLDKRYDSVNELVFFALVIQTVCPQVLFQLSHFQLFHFALKKHSLNVSYQGSILIHVLLL